jgi:short-subunit dehydrogenase
MVIASTSVLGHAICVRLEQDGCMVSRLSRRSPTIGHQFCDIRDSGSVARAIDAIVRERGVPDAVVYAAGLPAMGRTCAVPEHVAREAWEVNYWGITRVVNEMSPHFTKARRGTFVALLSIASLQAVPYESHYSASKAAAARFLECLNFESGELPIRFKYLCPGFIDTGFRERDAWYGVDAPNVRGSGIQPSDVAQAVLEMLREPNEVRRVLGWREKTIDYTSRFAPKIYEYLLHRRVRAKS